MADRTVIVEFKALTAGLETGFREAVGLTEDGAGRIAAQLDAMAEAAEVSAKDAATGMAKFAGVLADAATGSAFAVETLKALGIEGKDLSAILQGPLLGSAQAVTAALGRFEDQQIATALAQRFFGEHATAAIAAMRQYQASTDAAHTGSVKAGQAIERAGDEFKGATPKIRQAGEDLRETGEKAQRAGGQVESATTSMGRGLRSLIGAASGLVSVNQAIALGERTWRGLERVVESTVGAVVREGSRLVDESHRLGAPVETLSALGFAAEQASVPIASLGVAVRVSSRAVSEARDPTSEYFAILTQGLGLSRAQIDALQTADAVTRLVTLGEAFARTGDTAEKAADQQKVFGLGYQNVQQLLAEGPEVLRRNIALAERLGATWQTQDAVAAERLGDSVQAVWAAVDGLRTRLFGGNDLLDRFADIADRAAERVAQIGRDIPQEQLDKFKTSMVAAADATVKLAERGIAAFIEKAPALAGWLEHLANNAERYARYISGVTASTAAGAAVGSVVPGVGTVTGGLFGLGTGLIGTGLDLLVDPIKAAAPEAQALATRLAEVKAQIADIESRGWLLRNGDARLRALREEAAALEAELRKTVTVTSSAPATVGGAGFVGPLLPTGAESGRPYGRPPTDTAAGAAAESEKIRAIFTAEQEALTAAEDAGATRRLAIIRSFTEQVAAIAGERSAAYARQRALEIQGERDVARETVAMKRQEIDAARDAALAELDQKREALESEARIGRISQAELADALRDYYAERYRIIADALREEAKLTQNPVVQQRVELDIAKAGLEEQGALAGIDAKQVEDQLGQIRGYIDEVFGAIDAAADRSVQGLIQGTLTWREAWANAGEAVLAEFVSLGVRMIARQAADVVYGVALHTAGESAKTQVTGASTAIRLGYELASKAKKAAIWFGEAAVFGAVEVAKTGYTIAGTAARRAIEAGSAIKEIFIAAKSAAAKAYNAMAGIPYVGPALGAVAAAAVFAAVLAFGAGISSAEGGMERVPTDDHLALLHKDEMVLPAAIAEMVRALVGGGTGGATQLGMLASIAAAAGGVPGAPGGPAFLSSQAGLARVPPGGAVGVLHPDETVLPGDFFREHRLVSGEGDTSGGEGEKAGRGGPGGRGAGPAEQGEKSAIGAVTASVPFNATAAAGSAGGSKVQRVSVVSAPATLSTKTVAPVETTVTTPVQTTPAGGVTPTQEQGVRSVQIVNVPMPVSFNAIQTMATISIAPFGIGTTIGFGTINAFRRGGIVPEDQLAVLHQREMVLPADIAPTLTRLTELVPRGADSPEVLGRVTLPADLLASIDRFESRSSEVARSFETRRESEQRALLETLTAIEVRGGDHYEISMLDATHVEDMVARHREVFASPAFDKLNRQNRGLRAGRR